MPKRVPRWFWSKVAKPKWLTVFSTIGYLIALGIGSYAIVNQPQSLEAAIGELAMYSLCVLLVVAGAIGAPTALFGEWKIERFMAALAALGTFIYVVLIVVMHAEGTGNRLLQAGEVSIALLAMIARAVYTWQRPIAPKEEIVLGPDRG